MTISELSKDEADFGASLFETEQWKKIVGPVLQAEIEKAINDLISTPREAEAGYIRGLRTILTLQRKLQSKGF